MAIELSNLTFTEQDDIVPQFGVEEIFNTGITNTLAGNDIITGENTYSIPEGSIPVNSGIRTYGGILDTGNGNDRITGIYDELKGDLYAGFGIYILESTIDTGDGDDIITGTSIDIGHGIHSYRSFIKTGDGNDIITGSVQGGEGVGISHGYSTIDTGNGNDIINGTALRGITFGFEATVTTGEGNDTIAGTSTGDIVTRGIGLENLDIYNTIVDTGDGDDLITGTAPHGYGIVNNANMTTGDGNDTIIGIGSINYYGIINSFSDSIINTGNGADSIIFQGNLLNRGGLFLGDGNDSITADTDFPNRALENINMIDTGNGNDIITSTGIIYNQSVTFYTQGVINTGSGNDSIIGDGGVYNNSGASINTGDGNDIITSSRVIYNESIINTGDGNDSIIATEGFESAPNSSGAWFLGEGEDYIKGFGSGDFYGGNGFDKLELTPGSYTLKRWTDNTGESVVFTKGNSLMITSEFEKLIAGGTIYDFTSLTEGQIITVA
jgi:Ca2+-binding RTX toxin-like protein